MFAVVSTPYAPSLYRGGVFVSNATRRPEMDIHRMPLFNAFALRLSILGHRLLSRKLARAVADMVRLGSRILPPSLPLPR